MAHFDIEVSNHAPCGRADAAAVGSYLCNLHRWGARGIEHSFIKLGGHDPSELPIGALAPLMLQIAEARAKGYRKKEEVPFSRLVGMTLLRMCMHPFQSPSGRQDADLTAEYVESFAFVPDVNTMYAASYNHDNAKISQNGISTHVRVAVPGGSQLVTAQHLLATPQLEQSYPVTHVAPSIAAVSARKDAWVALRAMPDETRFVETLVSHEELMDTFQPVG